MVYRNNIDYTGPNNEKAVIFAAPARQGTRIEIGLQVWNKRAHLWEKRLTTHVLPDDAVGIAFELQRLADKASAAGFMPLAISGAADC